MYNGRKSPPRLILPIIRLLCSNPLIFGVKNCSPKIYDIFSPVFGIFDFARTCTSYQCTSTNFGTNFQTLIFSRCLIVRIIYFWKLATVFYLWIEKFYGSDSAAGPRWKFKKTHLERTWIKKLNKKIRK